jgi:hypothetical protein
MKARYKHLLSHSVQMAVAAIEIYNKPHFSHREQIFAILIVAAWESLLKARILQREKNRLYRLYVKLSPRKYKLNRSKQPMTIDIYEAMRKAEVPEVVAANIGHLVEIRDAAIHLTVDSPNLPHLVFMLGTASLRNYEALCRQWFAKSLAKYNFYVMPLAFSAPCQRLNLLDKSLDPAEIAAIVESATGSVDSLDTSSGYEFVCEVIAELVSAKKLTTAPDITASIAQAGHTATVFHRPVQPLDRYPLSATQLSDRVQREMPSVKRKDVWSAIKTLKIKGKPEYSKYSYPTKAAELAGPKKATGVIYNHDAVRLIVDYLQSLAAGAPSDSVMRTRDQDRGKGDSDQI